jgi:hypothetical protein
MRTSLQWLIESTGLTVQTFESADVFLADYAPGRDPHKFHYSKRRNDYQRINER